jgi:two-component system response regulator PilR (NtrC family)
MIEEAAVQRATLPISVLVVEDEESTRKLCADVAESCGMKVVVAGSVEEALRRLETHAVVTDLILPPSSSLDLLKQVHEMYPQVAVLVLTQYGTIDSAVAATRMGASIGSSPPSPRASALVWDSPLCSAWCVNTAAR